MSAIKRRLELCLSPALLPCYQLEGKIVVVIDVLRATTAMCMGFAHGVSAIRPVAEPADCLPWQQKGYLVAAERNGQVVAGFDFGNSPYAFMRPEMQGKKVALTTTNGTRALQLAAAADVVCVGAFVNLHAVCKFLKQDERDVLLLCAGWKNNFNLEDSLFGGAVVAELSADFSEKCDASLAAALLYEQAKNDLFGFIQQSSHYKRLAHMGIEADIKLAMQCNLVDVLPRMVGEELQLL
jgi:2-phosphosulfolactate phosphatase